MIQADDDAFSECIACHKQIKEAASFDNAHGFKCDIFYCEGCRFNQVEYSQGDDIGKVLTDQSCAELLNIFSDQNFHLEQIRSVCPEHRNFYCPYCQVRMSRQGSCSEPNDTNNIQELANKLASGQDVSVVSDEIISTILQCDGCSRRYEAKYHPDKAATELKELGIQLS